MIGLANGMISQMINNGTGLVTGQIQIHSPQYLPDRSVYETLGSHPNDVESLLGIIERDPAVIAAAPPCLRRWTGKFRRGDLPCNPHGNRSGERG